MTRQASATDWTATKHAQLPVKQRLAECPDFLQEIVRHAEKYLSVSRVWILGSRARGDAVSLSDYDIVFDVPPETASDWPLFVGELRERAKTLLSIDWILYSQLSSTMKGSLNSEGILIYDKR